MITGHREVLRVRKGRCQLVDRIVLGSRDEQRRDRGQVGACIERFGGQRFHEQHHLIPVEVGLRDPGCEFGELGVGRLGFAFATARSNSMSISASHASFVPSPSRTRRPTRPVAAKGQANRAPSE